MQRTSRGGGGLKVDARRQDKGAASEGAPAPASAQSRLLETYLLKRENLLRYLAARCGSRSQAEDLAQDLFVKITALDPALQVESPTALLYRMAGNLATDQVRRRRNAMARDRAWGETQSLFGEAAADQPGGERAVAARQSLAALLAGVETLPPRCREAFRLHKLEGHTCAETARILGVSPKAVEKQITAALKALAWPREP